MEYSQKFAHLNDEQQIEAAGLKDGNIPSQGALISPEHQQYSVFNQNQEYYQGQNPQPQFQFPSNVMQSHSIINLGPMTLETTVYDPQSLFKVNSRGSQLAICSTCQKYVQTLVDYQAGTGSILTGGLIALVGGWIGCCIIPCVLEDCKDAIHYCPSCGSELGKKKFIVNS